MTDNEKRAHDLAVACIPHVFKECDWPYYIENKNSTFDVNPDIMDTYLEFYNHFLSEL